MPGQFEGLRNLSERLQHLTAEMEKTADPVERERLYGKLKKLQADMSEWGAQTERDAESGDQEAKMLLADIDLLMEDEEPESG